MIKNFEPRLYQQTILGTAANKNTLVVLPTGLGKTAIAFLLAAQRLHNYPNSKILLLAPTKPLCEQHVESFKKHLQVPEERIILFTGSVKPEKRAELWKEATIIVSTPQGLENDTINRRVKLEDVSLLIFDEAHHATGDYAYVWLADQYEKKSINGRILALTASPGSDLEKIQEVCQNLKIERVEVRTVKDSDVKPYIQETKVVWEKVEFPERFKVVQKHLKDCKKTKLLGMQKLGYARSADMLKGEMLGTQRELQKQLSSGIRDFDVMKSISLLAEALKVDHALELLESQGIKPLHTYLTKLNQESISSKVKAVKNLVIDENFKSALHFTQDLIEKDIKHPKQLRMQELVLDIITKDKGSKVIIFTQFRDSAEDVVITLNEMNISNHIFFGQAKKNGVGFSQKQQKEILEKFKDGEFNVLIATSVAEEGLDIPSVDKVIFYEPVPSAIRSIQRRGRTGRLERGEVTILVTSGTRDEGYRWSSHHKEKRMYRTLEKLKSEFTLTKPETTLHKFIPEEQVVAILADHREKDNKIVKELIDLGISVNTAQLESADYVVSGKVGVELKKVPDFVASIVDGRLLNQVKELQNNFEKSVLVIEGEEDIYSVRKVHANAIRGMLASIVLGFNVPILYTKNPKDTAGLLAVMAKREQDSGRDFSHHSAKPKSMKEVQEFIVSAFPGIGVQNARNLLEKFGSVKNLVNASKEEMMEVEGIGDKITDRLLKVVIEQYKKKN